MDHTGAVWELRTAHAVSISLKLTQVRKCCRPVSAYSIMNNNNSCSQPPPSEGDDQRKLSWDQAGWEGPGGCSSLFMRGIKPPCTIKLQYDGQKCRALHHSQLIRHVLQYVVKLFVLRAPTLAGVCVCVRVDLYTCVYECLSQSWAVGTIDLTATLTLRV